MEEQTAGIKQALFGAFDFEAAAADKNFNEAQVRAAVTDPLLKALGYTQETILRDKALRSAFLRTGSKKRKVNLIPDYVLKVGGSAAWVLDAKAPWQQILDNGNIEQAYSYAAHPEIRSVYFALCNGLEFACWRTADDGRPALHFPVSGIDGYWEALRRLLSPESFQPGKKVEYEKPASGGVKNFDYSGRPLLKEIPLRRQAVRRHFGVHPYFTKQSWNVVSKYIENYTQMGDTVLDPFGGSGITVIEALMLKRKAINIDINPFAVFLVDALAAPVNEFELRDAFERIKKEYIEHEPKTKKSVKEIIEAYHGPKAIALPKGSDVETVPDLFSEKQMARLSLLKALIKKINKQKDTGVYKTLMLMFSGIVHFYNNTSFDGPHGNTGSSAMWMYRYRIAEKPAETGFLKLLDCRFKRILAAKKEMAVFINERTIQNAQVVKGTAADLSFLEKESIDYIYTDPPYGKNIPYLDLSAMWLAWLDLDVSEQDYALEAIEGGSREKSKEEYKKLIAESIQEMYRVLKFDRWLSFVFAHKDPEFWHLIIETCEKSGFEYRGAVPQKNGSSNYHKRQHPFTVLSGQLIINFRKVKNPRTVLKANLGMDIGEIVLQTIEGVIAKNDGAFLEQINDEIIIKGLEMGFLDLLKKEYSDLTPLLLDRFDYDQNSGKYTVKKDTKFQTHIDARLRIQYYLISYLRRMEWENKSPSFNDIVLAIMPLLRNGSTPVNQTILSVLEDIGEKTGQGAWRLKPEGQRDLEF